MSEITALGLSLIALIVGLAVAVLCMELISRTLKRLSGPAVHSVEVQEAVQASIVQRPVETSSARFHLEAWPESENQADRRHR
ncbi:hypothetical protein ACFQE1_02190 [Halobium palmae]|uniref:Uncharacterized protein n=1 Tax=Halobium palmae TaxID=1776492 RepID=A0ABD5RVR5_9EURY